MRTLVFAFAVGFGLVACGGGEKPPENPNPNPTPSASASAAPSATPSASASTAPSAAPVAWKDMTREQKADVMKNKVMPKLSEDFQAFDAKHYADFSCKTCHGEAAVKDKSFKMPNPALPKLPANPDGFKALMAKKGPVMKFMGEKVKPDMVAILGVEPYEPGKNEKGWGCYNCHEMQK